MVLPYESRSDGTVAFLPHRLNRQPVVVWGLTAEELWICTGLSAAAGLLMGIPLSLLLSTIALVPTLVVVGIVLGVFVGGAVMRPQKRNRPETWLYRQVQWRISRQLSMCRPTCVQAACASGGKCRRSPSTPSPSTFFSS